MHTTAHRIGGILVAMSMIIGAAPEPVQRLREAFDSISPDGILRHIKALAADEFEGRLPGSPGEEKTVAYLTDQLKEMGLKPGNPDGTFVQKVPLLGFQATKVEGAIEAGGKEIQLEFPRNFVGVPGRAGRPAKINDSEIVFVGYGVNAPEYNWDDYKGVDLKGKTLLMLVGDPPVPDPADPSKLDPAVFKGRAMTYYGRWTYKYEVAAKVGATAAILIHEEGPAGYPFSVVQGSWSLENFDIAKVPGDTTEDEGVPVNGWIDLPTAKQLFEAAGQEFAQLKSTAIRRDFKPVPLKAHASFRIETSNRLVQSHNVVAKLEGSDPALRDEYVIYTAHWDHLGRDPGLTGDQIYNGAADNASGVAAILEIARAFTRVRPAPKRSILFLFVTGEEKGLLGSKYYASQPLYPLVKTVADLNLDVINLWGKTSDLISIGMGQSTLDDVLVEVAGSRGRTVGPDAEPEKGYYYRSDHFELAKQGVPALDPKAGRKYLNRPDDYAQQKMDQYTQKDYHKVSDEVKPDWDLSGAAEDMRVMLEVGFRVAEAGEFPRWKPGSEFRARREAMLKAASH